MRGKGLLRVLAAAAALGLTATATGCSGMQAESQPRDNGDAQATVAKPRPGGKLVFGLESDPNGLDPTRNAWDNAGIQLANALYDPLVTFDAEGHTKPYLAESITPSPDFRTWITKLRPGIRYHDGKPVTAADAVYHTNAVRNSAVTGSPSRNIIDATVIDDLTYKISMKQPWASFPTILAGQGGYLVSPDQLTDANGKDGRSNAIGTGPFILKSWKTDERFELVKNPSYWRTGLPLLDAVEFVVTDRGRDRLDRIREGTMDATALTRLDDVKALEEELARPNARVVAANDPSDAEKDTITFNTLKPPFNDVRIRQAIAFGTDVAALAKTHGWPTDRAAPGLLAPSSPYYSPVPRPQTDLARARALVRDYLSDPKVKSKPKELVVTLTGADLNASWLQDLVAQWARVGITTKLNLVEAKQLVRFTVLGNFDVAVIRYFAAQDPDVLWHFFVSDTVSESGISVNFAHFRNDELTAAFNEGRATLDVERRKQAYARAETVISQQVPYFWINRMEWRMVTSPKVRDARNVTLPDGSPALPYLAGSFRLTETWIDG